MAAELTSATMIATTRTPTTQVAPSRPALDALEWYIRNDHSLTEGKEILFCRARFHPLLKLIAPENVSYEQTFLPYVNALQAREKEVCQRIKTSYDLILYPGSKHKNETLWYISQCYNALRGGGSLLFVIENNHGAASYKKLFEQAGLTFFSESKRKSRIYVVTKDSSDDEKPLEQWRSLASQKNSAGLATHPAAFSADKPDPASELLISCIENLSGIGADLGAGYGYLTVRAASAFPQISQIDLYEAELHALEAARQNLSDDARINYYWADVQSGLPAHQYDWIVMNPPYHIERQHSLSLLRSFISQAKASLKQSGHLYCVSQKSFPLSEILKQHFGTVNLLKANGTFECYTAQA